MRIMHNYLQNAIFLDHNLKVYKKIEMHSKYDNMHTNRIFNALNCINNHVNSCKNCMLSGIIYQDIIPMLSSSYDAHVDYVTSCVEILRQHWVLFGESVH